ncbi:MAG: response regulator, partial [Candidatus Omnitrophica bacterium]|nr:response regulator [Candidatus Omnitrophota bacterium]
RYTNEEIPRKYFSGGWKGFSGKPIEIKNIEDANRVYPPGKEFVVKKNRWRFLQMLMRANGIVPVDFQGEQEKADDVKINFIGANGNAALPAVTRPAASPRNAAMTAESERLAHQFVDHMKNQSFPSFNIPADQLTRAKQEGEKNWAISRALLGKLQSQLADWGVAPNLSGPVFEHLDYEYDKATDSFRVVYANPAMITPQQAAQLPSPSANKENAQFTVLVVDDDVQIRSLVTMILSSEGFRVKEATNGQEALDMIAGNPGEFWGVVTDQQMPVMDGLELAKNLKERFPQLKVVMHTGQVGGDFEALKERVPDNVNGLLQKPSSGLQMGKVLNYLRIQSQAAANPAMMAEKVRTFVDSSYKNLANLRALIPAIQSNFGSVETFMQAARNAGYEFAKASQYPMSGAIDTVQDRIVTGFNEVHRENLLTLRYQGQPVNDRIIFFQPPEESNAAMVSNTRRNPFREKLITAAAVAGGVAATTLVAWNPVKQHLELSRATEIQPGYVEHVSPNSPSKKLVINKGGVAIVVTVPGQNQIMTENVMPENLNRTIDWLRRNTPSNAVIHVFYDGTGEGMAGTLFNSFPAGKVSQHKVYLNEAGKLNMVFTSNGQGIHMHYFSFDGFSYGVDHTYDELRGDLRQLPNGNNPNPAMSSSRENALIAESMKKQGGIDLNAANLNMLIKRDGNGVPLPWVQQDLTPFKKIQGFVPQIVEIHPALNVPIISELQQKLQTP